MRRIAAAWALAFFTAWIALPLGAVLFRGVTTGLPTLFDARLLRLVAFTVQQAGLSTALSVAIGLPLGWAFGRGGRSVWALRFLALPYGVPTLIATIAAIRWFGKYGWLGGLGWAYSLTAVIAVHVLYNAPFLALRVAQARAGVPRSLVEAGRTLGAGGWRLFREIDWPYLRFPVAATICQIFSLCVMSFAVVLLLGGGPPVETLETAIYSRLRFGTLDLPGAVGAAFWELVICLLPWLAVLWIQRGSAALGLPVDGVRPRETRGVRAVDFVLAAAAGFFPLWFLLPFAESVPLVVGWLARDPAFRAVLAEPLALSIGLATSAALLAVTTALAAAAAPPRLRGGLELALSAPSGISILVIGLGAWLLYGNWIDPFEGSFLILACLQAAAFLPLAVRSLAPLVRGVRRESLEAARTLGASPARAFFEVEWPRWKRPVIETFAMVAAAAVGEVSAASLFYSERLIPLPVQIARWMARYRYTEARSAALVLLALAFAAIVLAARRESGEVERSL